jgi:hypothetical protein
MNKKIITVVINQKDLDTINAGCEKEMRSRSQFLVLAGLDRATELLNKNE